MDWLALALMAKLGCAERCRIQSIEKVEVRPGHADLAVRTRRSGHCGTISDWTLFDGALKPLLSVDEDVDRACGGAPEERVHRRVVLGHGTVRAGEREWRWSGDRFVVK